MNRPLTTAIALLCAAAFTGAASAQTGSGSGGSAGTGSGSTGAGSTSGGSTAGGTASGKSAGGSAGATSKLARADRDFLEKAAHANFAEIESSKLAQSKATNADVKKFAQQMIDDHTKASQELAQLAQSKGVKLPDGPAMAQKAKAKVLSTRDGDKFDREYGQEIGVKAHRDTVQLFEKASQGAQDPEVKAFAQKMLPQLQHHLQMAQALPGAGSGGKGGDASSGGKGGGANSGSAAGGRSGGSSGGGSPAGTGTPGGGTTGSGATGGGGTSGTGGPSGGTGGAGGGTGR